MVKTVVNIRLDKNLWQQARSVAVRQGKTMQDWLTEVIIQKLQSDGVEVEQDTGISPKD